MLEALIAGQRDPQVLAGLARGQMKAKRAALVEALDRACSMTITASWPGMLLDQIDAPDRPDRRRSPPGSTELIAAIPAARGVDADGDHRPRRRHRPGRRRCCPP